VPVVYGGMNCLHFGWQRFANKMLTTDGIIIIQAEIFHTED
jgi:hypothetical protein